MDELWQRERLPCRWRVLSERPRRWRIQKKSKDWSHTWNNLDYSRTRSIWATDRTDPIWITARLHPKSYLDLIAACMPQSCISLVHCAEVFDVTSVLTIALRSTHTHDTVPDKHSCSHPRHDDSSRTLPNMHCSTQLWPVMLMDQQSGRRVLN